MDLSGLWQAHPADEAVAREFAGPDFDATGWIDAPVPGHWGTTDGLGPTLTGAYYRRPLDHPITAPDKRAWLRFDGIFYQSDVWFDGQYLGDTEGYFFPHTFEITDFTRDRTEHLVAVEVNSPHAGDGKLHNFTGALQDSDLVATHWNAGGIWRPVHLIETGPVVIRFFKAVCIDATGERARVGLRAVLHTHKTTEVTLRTTFGTVDHELVQPLAAGENRVEWTIDIDRPGRWWPASMGDQQLYDLDVEVQLEDGTVSDHRHRRMGVRSVSMRNWVFSINGERMFTKGANLAPVRQALADATTDEIVGDLQAAAEAGLDMLRVHTHISRPELYDAADKLGVMLWQDMPLHGAYARSVRKQARRQARELVDLLGHHPSIVVWCGHHEPLPLPTDRPSPPLLAQQAPSWNRSVLDRTIKGVLNEVDGSRPVVPHSSVAPHVPQLDGTDSQLWFGWRSRRASDLAEYAAQLPRLARFVSAFGAQAVPDDAEFCDEERWPDLDWHRLARRYGYDRIAMEQRVPPAHYSSFADWTAATQRHQAHVVKTTVELLRRLKYNPTGGFFQYTLADAYPSIGFSLLDHQRRPKPAFRALVDACRPVIVVADPLPHLMVVGAPLAIDIHVVSEKRSPLREARVKAVLDLYGHRRTWEWEGDIPADGVARIGQVTWPAMHHETEIELDLELTGAATATNRYSQFLKVISPEGL
ncbi:MAG: hypothetical protein HKN26_08470 [Acidimicrobiales bacterium]|nr:hypothetical protein [Acidimicrobiales bacterium]